MYTVWKRVHPVSTPCTPLVHGAKDRWQGETWRERPVGEKGIVELAASSRTGFVSGAGSRDALKCYLQQVAGRRLSFYS